MKVDETIHLRWGPGNRTTPGGAAVAPRRRPPSRSHLGAVGAVVLAATQVAGALLVALGVGVGVGLCSSVADACTSILVTPGASADGAAMVTHTVDSGPSPFEIAKVPARDPGSGGMVDILDLPRYTDGHQTHEVAGKPTGYRIPEVLHSYGYIEAIFGIINEKQVAIGETMLGGRRESRNDSGWLEITKLSVLAMERAAAARDDPGNGGPGHDVQPQRLRRGAVRRRPARVLGVRDSGAGASLAAWDRGFWVARRVPDGHVSASANVPVIGETDWNDPENFMYSKSILDYAIRQGRFDPAGGENFRWSRDFCGSTYSPTRHRQTWRAFSLAAPSLTATLDERCLSFSVPVDRRLTLSDIMAMSRDHYEGTQ